MNDESNQPLAYVSSGRLIVQAIHCDSAASKCIQIPRECLCMSESDGSPSMLTMIVIIDSVVEKEPGVLWASGGPRR